MKFHPSKDDDSSVVTQIERALPSSATYLQPGNNFKEIKEDVYSARSRVQPNHLHIQWPPVLILRARSASSRNGTWTQAANISRTSSERFMGKAIALPALQLH